MRRAYSKMVTCRDISEKGNDHREDRTEKVAISSSTIASDGPPSPLGKVGTLPLPSFKQFRLAYSNLFRGGEDVVPYGTTPKNDRQQIPHAKRASLTQRSFILFSTGRVCYGAQHCHVLLRKVDHVPYAYLSIGAFYRNIRILSL